MRFFTPGPSQLSESVRPLLQQALEQDVFSISHRSKEFEKIFTRAVTGLRTLLHIPATHRVFFLSSATEAWERIVQNCSREHTYHVVNGAFSERFYVTALELKRTAALEQVQPGQGIDLKTVSVPDESELLCLTHNETSTGVSIPEADISALKKRYSGKLVAVDIVSSAPIVNLDWSDIDCGFFSVQKCFGLPAGLGVIAVSEAAYAKSEQLVRDGASIGSYHSFPSLASFAAKNQTPETPNVLALYLLAGVTEKFLTDGIDSIRSETAARAKLIYDFVSQQSNLKLFVEDARYRSITVVTVEVTGGAKKLLEELATRGFEVGSGYGKFKDTHIRIANFPMHSREQLLSLLSAIKNVS